MDPAGCVDMMCGRDALIQAVENTTKHMYNGETIMKQLMEDIERYGVDVRVVLLAVPALVTEPDTGSIKVWGDYMVVSKNKVLLKNGIARIQANPRPGNGKEVKVYWIVAANPGIYGKIAHKHQCQLAMKLVDEKYYYGTEFELW